MLSVTEADSVDFSIWKDFSMGINSNLIYKPAVDCSVRVGLVSSCFVFVQLLSFSLCESFLFSALPFSLLIVFTGAHVTVASTLNR